MNNLSPQSSIHFERLSREHIQSVVDLHLEAYREGLNFGKQLGRGFIVKTYEWFTTTGVGFVAISNNKIVGCVVGAKNYSASALNRYRAWEGLKSAFCDLTIGKKLISKLGDIYAKPTKLPMEYVWLYSIAVCPQHKRMGIAKGLVQEFEAYAIKDNREGLIVSVGIQNTASQALFTSNSYTFSHSTKDEHWFLKRFS